MFIGYSRLELCPKTRSFATDILLQDIS